MNTLHKLVINYSEYQFFKTLSNPDKVNYLFDAYTSRTITPKQLLDLSEFFGSVASDLAEELPALELPIAEQNIDFVDVVIDDENIMLESNSLRAVRHVTNKFMESGYMLRRDLVTEKMFRKDKTTKYLRVFKIISYTNSLCLN
jgi:hypothetical protein